MLALIVAIPVATGLLNRRRRSAQEARRKERQRIRMRDWAVINWLYGRSKLRITHQPSPEQRED
ncbi:hypothetical protein P1X14_20435 [Sphingomonas sp. AOB5]|uniref:hypothetical protein n=1 Tax=Sphingomonas sp. AOB5 TaxID=3034017 RepID=UPI0023F78853|nr:hypothetical protein [Sphingomonas sp. AOB5]MDF7777634.1 hypothetical protein [Sphingomonas sp. AOB5]